MKTLREKFPACQIAFEPTHGILAVSQRNEGEWFEMPLLISQGITDKQMGAAKEDLGKWEEHIASMVHSITK